MKRIRYFIIELLICICVFSFVGCGNGSDSNSDGVVLTLDNYDDYVSIDSVKLYGAGNKYWSSTNSTYMYSHAQADAQINGVSMLRHNFMDTH